MSLSLSRRLVAVCAAAAVLPFVGVDAASAAGGRAAIVVRTTSQDTVAVASQVVPGSVAIRNTGTGMVLIVRARAKADEATFVRDYNSSTPAGMARDFVIVAELSGRRTVFAKLTAGSYFVADEDTADELTAANVAAVTVSGKTVNGIAPSATTVSIDPHAKLSVPATVSRLRYLHVLNHASPYEQVILAQRAKGTTDRAAADFVAHPSLKKVSTVASKFIPIALLDSGQSIYANFSAKAGRYFLLTVTVDRRTATFALRSGQVRAVTLK